MPVSIPISEGMMNSIAEKQTSAQDVEVRKGLGVIAGTVDNQVKPIATGETGSPLTTIQGIAQDDANAGDTVRVAVAGQIAIARITSTCNRGDYLTCEEGSTTDAENGMLQAQTTIANGDLIIGKALEDGTDKSYIKIMVMLYRVTAS